MNRALLLLAVVLLLLPFLYVGSYLALVIPGEVPGTWPPSSGPKIKYMISPTNTFWENYRCGDRAGKVVFWPLEQIDRRLRPSQWNPSRDFVGIEIPSWAEAMGRPEAIEAEEAEEAEEAREASGEAEE